MKQHRWLGQKLAALTTTISENTPPASDAPVVALPGHRRDGAVSL
ncbi:MAG: hypothetical protein ACREHD_07685 [Pirellulales bacterium]